MSANRNVAGPLDLPSSAVEKKQSFIRNMATDNARKPLKVSRMQGEKLIFVGCVSKIYVSKMPPLFYIKKMVTL